MDLVDEQERALPLRPAGAGGVEDLFQLRHARMDRRDLDERVRAHGADQPGDRGLAAAGRPPEDHRAERRRGEEPRQRAVRPGQVLLAGDLRKARRPQPLGQRRRRRLAPAAGASSNRLMRLFSRMRRGAVQRRALLMGRVADPAAARDLGNCSRFG